MWGYIVILIGIVFFLIDAYKENLPSSVDIVYQQKNPKLAYIKKLTFPMQPIVALLLLPLWK